LIRILSSFISKQHLLLLLEHIFKQLEQV
jgi:hypothetical protein